MFIANKTQENGSFSEGHRVGEIKLVNGVATAPVHGYETAAGMQATPPKGLNWTGYYVVPLAELADVDAWMVSPAGPFAGGTVIPAGDSVEVARVLKNAEINAARDQAEATSFPYLGKVFDADQRSVTRIYGAVFAAQAALAAGAEFSETWTLFDNDTLTMSAEDVIGMPVALAINAGTLHAKAKTLKAAVEAAESAEAVRAINWMSGVPTGTISGPTAAPIPAPTSVAPPAPTPMPVPEAE
jgi:hypothetical protein